MSGPEITRSVFDAAYLKKFSVDAQEPKKTEITKKENNKTDNTNAKFFTATPAKDERQVSPLLVVSKSAQLTKVFDPNQMSFFKGPIAIKNVNSTSPIINKAKVDENNNLADFKYSGIKFKDLISAQNWRPGTEGLSGVQANKAINEAYFALDKQFTKFIDGSNQNVETITKKNPVSNWMTYGKFASREAGSQIQNLEGAMEALETLKRFDGNGQNDRRSAKALIKIMDTGPMTKQAIRMAATSMGVEGADKMDSVDLVKSIITKVDITDTIKDSASRLIPIGKSQQTNGNAYKIIDGVINDLNTLHKALVKGNTEIYSNIVPAYDIFLKAESQGKNGVEALKSNGFGGPTGGTFINEKSKDPQGFIVKAFSEYKNAKKFEEKAKEAEQKNNPDEVVKLRKKRDESMHKANLLIGCQEQMAILQKPEVFGDKKVASMLKAMTGTMSIQDLPDSTGRFRENKLLSPNTATKNQNWADFGTRMGLTDITNQVKNDIDAEKLGAIKIKGPVHDEVHYFTLPNKNNGIAKGPDGTISAYFADNLKSSKMIVTAPRDIDHLYTDKKDGQIDFTDKVIDNIPGSTVVPLATDTIYRAATNAYDSLFD